MFNHHIVARCLWMHRKCTNKEQFAQAERWTDRLCQELLLLTVEEFKAFLNSYQYMAYCQL